MIEDVIYHPQDETKGDGHPKQKFHVKNKKMKHINAIYKF